MAETKRILVAAPLPPIVLASARAAPTRRRESLPRRDALAGLGRLAWFLAAFSLPALGLTFADLVHRADESRATQAAASFLPSNGAAVQTTVTRATRLVRVTPLSPLRQGDPA